MSWWGNVFLKDRHGRTPRCTDRSVLHDKFDLTEIIRGQNIVIINKYDDVAPGFAVPLRRAKDKPCSFSRTCLALGCQERSQATESKFIDPLSMSRSSHFSSGRICACRAAITRRMNSGRGLYEQTTTEIKSLNCISA